MSVTLSPPSQLGFPRPLTTVVKRALFIHNPHSSPVAFKVKTTAPKQYCVRPNQGRVEPNETIEVHIVLQPLPHDPPPHAKCKDKFLVQSTFIPPDEEIRTLPEMWTTVERNNKAAIHEQKIRCAYLPAEDGSGDPNGIPEEGEDSPLDTSKLDESAVFSAAEASPVPKTNGSSADHSPSNILAGAGVGAAVGAGAGAIGARSLQAEAAAPPSPSPAVPAAVPAAELTSAPIPALAKELPALSAADVSAVPATNRALEQSVLATTSQSEHEQLSAALKEIERLKAQLAEAQGPTVTGLRKRGGAADGAAAAGPGAKTAVATAPAAQGVPVEVCAGLVFAVFVLTYLFF